MDVIPVSPPPPESSAPRPGALLAPLIGRHHVARPRLDALLDEAVEAPLLVVSAPAGAGKSTALSGWLHRHGGTTAWYSLERDDNDPAVFWPSLALTLDLPDSADSRSARDVARALFDNERAPRSGPTVLVLDDYHTITNATIHRGVDKLVVEAPASFRLIISTRHDPPLTLAKLRAQGNLHEIRYRDLRFDDAEVSAVLNGEMGIGLAAPDISRLTERTEGWAAGVQLVGLTLQHRTDQAEFVEQFAGDDRHISDYMREEVLAGLPGQLRDFLYATAILDRFNSQLCHAVTGVHDAQQMLDELDRMNLFVIPLDHRREWFRYHHLFAEWLRLQAPNDPRERHRLAAEWLAAHGHPGDAIRHYVQAGEADRGAEIIDRERWVLVGQGREETLRDWTQMLPVEVRRRHPQLTLGAAWVAHHAGRWDDLHSLVDAFHDEALPVAVGDRPLIEGELALLESGRLIALGQTEAALRLAHDGLAYLPDDEPRARTGLLLVTGRCHMASGDFEAAALAFRAAVDLAAPYRGITIVQVIAGAHLAEIDRLHGRTADAEANSRAVLELAERAGLDDNAECSVALLTLGNVLLDVGQREEAELVIARGTELAARMPYVAREHQAKAANARLSERGRAPAVAFVEPITGRELSVLRLLPTSLTPREIAGELYLSLNTIKTHTRALYRKLGVQSRHAAIEEARRRQLI